MILNKLQIDMFPEISFNGELLKNDGNDFSNLPICQLYNKISLSRSVRLLLWGEASLGKSSSINVLKIYLLKINRPFLYLNLKYLNSGGDGYEAFKNRVRHCPNDVIVLLDSFDELYNKEAKFKIIDFINAQTAEADLNDKISRISILVVGRYSKETDTNEYFSLFSKANMLSLSDCQVAKILKKRVDKNIYDELLRNDSSKLLRTTMYLAMYLSILDSGDIAGSEIDLSNIARFIERYLQLIYREKMYSKYKKEYGEEYKSQCTQALINLGKQIWIGYNKGNSSVFSSNFDESIQMLKWKFDNIIPPELNGIFYYQNGYLFANQKIYLIFSFAVYLLDQLNMEYVIKGAKNTRSIFGDIANEDIDYLIPENALEPDKSECLYLLGQIVRNRDTKFIEFIVTRLQSGNDPLMGFVHVLDFYLGYSCDKIDDSKILGELIAISSFAYQKIKTLCFNGNLERETVSLLKRCNNLNTINVNCNNYFSFDNCLIDKENAHIVIKGQACIFGEGWNALGLDACLEAGAVYCGKEEELILPESIISIETESICESYYRKIVFSDRVSLIQNGAIYKCENLQEIEVAKENVYYHSIDNCLIDKQNGVLIAGCKGSVIPSDGIVRTIGSFAFYGSGVNEINIPNGVTQIDESAIKEESSLRTMSLGADVNTIANGAIAGCYKLCDVFVSPNNKKYEAVNGCLIEKDEGKLIYVFGKAQIPQEKIIHSLAMGAFLNCSFEEPIAIPDTVNVVEEGAFVGTEAESQMGLISRMRQKKEYDKEQFFYGGYAVRRHVKEVAFNQFIGVFENGYSYVGNADNPYLILVMADSSILPERVISSNAKIIYKVQTNYDIVIPANIKYISNHALDCGGTVTFNNEFIGEYVFKKHSNPKKIIISNSVQHVDEKAFNDISRTVISVPKHLAHLKVGLEIMGHTVEVQE